MDTKIEIKEEDPLSLNLTSQFETVFSSKNITKNRNSNAAVLDDDCCFAIRREVKSETVSLSHTDRECFTNNFIEHTKSETVNCTSNYEIDIKTEIEEQTLVSDFVLQNEKEYLLEDSAKKDKKYKYDHEMDSKIEMIEELWWSENKTSSVCDDFKDGNFTPAAFSRLCTEAVSGDSSGESPLTSAEHLRNRHRLYNGKNCHKYAQNAKDMTDIPTVAEHVHSKQSGKYSDEEEMYSRTLQLKKKNLIHQNKRSYKCNICAKNFTQLSNLKRHNLIHEGQKLHQCKICDKSFTQLSDMKRHNFIHEGSKPYQCKTCDKCFTQLRNLRRHNLIHSNKKPYQCKACDKSFTQLSDIKKHNWIHEGKKPYQCKTCDTSFTRSSDLKRHNLSHDGKRPYQCKSCDKNFTQLSYLKIHILIHEGYRPHLCKTCNKRFSRLSHLKSHLMIHEGKKPHYCETCDKSFTELSSLKRHTLIHEGVKPHHCKTCDKNFTHLSSFKRHNLIHQCHEDI